MKFTKKLVSLAFAAGLAATLTPTNHAYATTGPSVTVNRTPDGYTCIRFIVPAPASASECSVARAMVGMSNALDGTDRELPQDPLVIVNPESNAVVHLYRHPRCPLRRLIVATGQPGRALTVTVQVKGETDDGQHQLVGMAEFGYLPESGPGVETSIDPQTGASQVSARPAANLGSPTTLFSYRQTTEEGLRRIVLLP
jgi:hypothetical protein